MLEFLTKLFDTSDFAPRWLCGTWSGAHGWLHIISDSAIFAAYAAIPLVIALVVVRRKADVPFPPVLVLFAAFILLCGFVHLVEATIFWTPWYRLSGLVKALTAVVSWATVVALIRVLPRVLALPGLAKVNRELEQARESLQGAHDELEERVERRTAELAAANERLVLQNQALEVANRDLDGFAHIASHDLKAPLRAVSSLAQWIVDDASDSLPEKSREHLETMQQRIGRMRRLLDDLLDYSRVGRVRGTLETIDTSTAVEAIVDLLGAPAGFEISVAPDMPAVRAHRAPLEQVLRNLIDNAIKHHDRPDGRIEVSGRLLDGCAEFVVRDDGPGISREFHDSVFEMFRTLGASDEANGTGLGLAVVKKLVDDAGGAITVESAAGEGTAFRFTWPNASEAQPALER